MARTAAADPVAVMRRVLQDCRDSGKLYPCPEPDFVRLFSAEHNTQQNTIKRLLTQDPTIVRCRKFGKRGSPFFLVFAGDEDLIFVVADDAIRVILETSEKPLAAEEIARLLGLAKEPPAIPCLTRQLHRMAKNNVIVAKGNRYEIPRRARDLEVIDLMGLLKRDYSYPVSVKSVAERLPPPKITQAKVKALLESMTKTGALQKIKKGMSWLYMFGDADPRYASKATDALKCELLTEIEKLRFKLAEYQQVTKEPDSGELGRESISSDGAIAGRILASLDEAERRSGRRTIELWELRGRLSDLSRETFDKTIQDLGRSRILELKPVQDLTKLSDYQRNSLLALADGTMILSVARLDGGI